MRIRANVPQQVDGVAVGRIARQRAKNLGRLQGLPGCAFIGRTVEGTGARARVEHPFWARNHHFVDADGSVTRYLQRRPGCPGVAADIVLRAGWRSVEVAQGVENQPTFGADGKSAFRNARAGHRHFLPADATIGTAMQGDSAHLQQGIRMVVVSVQQTETGHLAAVEQAGATVFRIKQVRFEVDLASDVDHLGPGGMGKGPNNGVDTCFIEEKVGPGSALIGAAVKPPGAGTMPVAGILPPQIKPAIGCFRKLNVVAECRSGQIGSQGKREAIVLALPNRQGGNRINPVREMAGDEHPGRVLGREAEDWDPAFAAVAAAHQPFVVELEKHIRIAGVDGQRTRARRRFDVGPVASAVVAALEVAEVLRINDVRVVGEHHRVSQIGGGHDGGEGPGMFSCLEGQG